MERPGALQAPGTRARAWLPRLRLGLGSEIDLVKGGPHSGLPYAPILGEGVGAKSGLKPPSKWGRGEKEEEKGTTRSGE